MELEIKKFIKLANEYLRHGTGDACAGEIQKHLEVIATIEDVNVFSTSSDIAKHFFVCLHQLINKLDSRSMLAWPAIAVLQKACKNSKAKTALIHTYKFIPLLTKFICLNGNNEKQLRLLQVMSELTYGITITWQEAHLPELISYLVQIIRGTSLERKAEALTVLVNLCYKNLHSLYVLMRNIEVSKFVKCVLTMNENPSTRMQVCKLLIIMGEIKGPLPDEQVLNFVDVTFNCVTDCFQRRDSKMLWQMVDFFRETSENAQVYSIILRYPKVYEDVKRLLDLIEYADSTDDCVLDSLAALFNFLPAALKIKISKTSKLIPRCIALAMPFLTKEKTSSSAIKTIMIATELITSSEFPEVVAALSDVINILACRLTFNDIEIKEERLTEMSGIVMLLAAMSGCPDLKKQIVETINVQTLRSLFGQLYDSKIKDKTVRSNEENKLAVQLLFMVATLSTFREDWMAFYLELLNEGSILNSIAFALIAGEKSLKYQVLRLVRGWGKDSLSALCDVLSEHTLYKFSENVEKNVRVSDAATDSMQLFVSETRISELLDRLHGIQMNDTNTSDLIELYEYKIASMGHTERRTQAALEAADARCIGLGHQIALLTGEIERLDRVRLSQQQALDGNAAERKSLLSQIDKFSVQSTEDKNNLNKKTKEFCHNLQELEKKLADQTARAQLTEQQLSEKLERTFQQLQEKILESDELKQKLSIQSTKYQEATATAETQISGYKQQLSDLQAECDEVRNTLSQCVEKMSHKDEQIADLSKRIQALEHIRETILSVAGRS